MGEMPFNRPHRKGKKKVKVRALGIVVNGRSFNLAIGDYRTDYLLRSEPIFHKNPSTLGCS